MGDSGEGVSGEGLDTLWGDVVTAEREMFGPKKAALFGIHVKSSTEPGSQRNALPHHRALRSENVRAGQEIAEHLVPPFHMQSRLSLRSNSWLMAPLQPVIRCHE